MRDVRQMLNRVAHFTPSFAARRARRLRMYARWYAFLSNFPRFFFAAIVSACGAAFALSNSLGCPILANASCGHVNLGLCLVSQIRHLGQSIHVSLTGRPSKNPSSTIASRIFFEIRLPRTTPGHDPQTHPSAR